MMKEKVSGSSGNGLQINKLDSCKENMNIFFSVGRQKRLHITVSQRYRQYSRSTREGWKIPITSAFKSRSNTSGEKEN